MEFQNQKGIHVCTHLLKKCVFNLLFGGMSDNVLYKSEMAGEKKSKHEKCVIPPKYHRELQKEPKLQLFNQLLFVSHMLNDKSGELFPL